MKTEFYSFGPTCWIGPRLRGTTARAARPSQPTARDGGRPARDDGFAETPPNYMTFTASAKTLFTQSTIL